MPSQPARGLPPRIALPIIAVLSLLFLGIMAYLVAQGFGVTGSVFGKAAKPGAVAGAQRPQGSQANVEGGPPPAVAEQLKTLRERIAKHPDDDVAITQLGDMYLAANRYAEAIPLYRRALKVNPHNVAAQTGLAEAQEALHETGSQ
ncbi:MAG TPA: tetratricopeptide repeat protein [Candidatus Baltobacteraceae bacterium]|nr:tetratricopeptide repeat protein [Candidatus Baltobacteraceae bacterium]